MSNKTYNGEAILIIPENSSSGDFSFDIHEEIEGALLSSFAYVFSTFGKFQRVIGEHRIEDEDVIIYTVQADNTQRTIDKLRGIAKDFGNILMYETIYLKKPNGEVELVDTGYKE